MTEAGEDDLLTSDAVSVGDIKAGERPRAVELWVRVVVADVCAGRLSCVVLGSLA